MTEKTLDANPASLDFEEQATGQEEAGTGAEGGLVLEDLLVEDVSIDGMCGVY